MAEVFGFPVDNESPEAKRYRRLRLCPFNNRVPNCTKDKAENPLGVCSVFDGSNIVSICPVRFRADWLIAEDAASFFFDQDAKWTSLTEVRLNDGLGKSAGNIDVVIAAYNSEGAVVDFGSLEVQAVYISGNIRRPFEAFMADSDKGAQFDWKGQKGYPAPDFVSSSRKRLAPQLMFKGGILHAWKKRMAVALDKALFETLPDIKEVTRDHAEVAWLNYDFDYDEDHRLVNMVRYRTVYATFHDSLDTITKPVVGPVDKFIEQLQTKLDNKLSPPDAPVLDAADI